jgi:hypothetical protein
MRVLRTIPVVLLLVAACGDGGDGTPSTSPATSQAVTTTTAAATTSVTVASSTTVTTMTTSTTQAAGAGEWVRVAADAAVFGGAGDQTMASVAAGGPGLVASGQDFSGGDGDAAVWVSADGLAWSRVLAGEAVFGGAADQAMVMVAAGGPGLVGVGYDFSGGDGEATVWTSPDGLTWSRVPADEAVFGGTGDQVMAALAAGGPGLVAAGYDSSGGDRDAAVWVSPDGLAWDRVPGNEGVFGGGADQTIWSVTAGGPGLVAAGYDSSGGDRDAAVWVSPDGLAWDRVPGNEGVFGGGADQTIWSVTAGGPGLVAVGDDVSGGDGDAAVWTSPDGLAWSRVPADGAVFGGVADQSLQAVASGGPGLVAVGFDFAGGDQDGAVWSSADGLVWSRASVEEAVLGGTNNQFMRRVMAGGPGLVVVGADSSGGDRDGAVWYWRSG